MPTIEQVRIAVSAYAALPDCEKDNTAYMTVLNDVDTWRDATTSVAQHIIKDGPGMTGGDLRFVEAEFSVVKSTFRQMTIELNHLADAAANKGCFADARRAYMATIDIALPSDDFLSVREHAKLGFMAVISHQPQQR